MSKPTIRVALPGYRVDTETNADHYALYGDEDWVLIKEKERGSISVGASSSEAITHGLGSIPLVFVYGQLSGESWTFILGDSSDLSAYIDVTPTQLIIHNNYASTKNFKYYIFYDEIIAPGLITKSMRYRVVGQTLSPHPILAVAKSGVSALESENPNDFIYHSDFNTFKIIDTGTVDFTV